MQNVALKHSNLPDDALFDVLNRDAALWVSASIDHSQAGLEWLARLMLLPWKLVLCESSSDDLVSVLNDLASESNALSLQRGFLHLIGADPATRQLPLRALPVYLLNGYDGASDRAESSRLTGMAAQRRRLNMIERLQSAAPKRVIWVGENLLPVMVQVEELWHSDFRSLLTFVTPMEGSAEELEKHFESLADLSSISVVSASIKDFAQDVVDRTSVLLPDASVVLRIRDGEGRISEVDVTQAELPEQPIIEHFEIIRSRDLRRLTESDLTIDDLDNFFGRENHSWRPFAAGLPWVHDSSCSKRLFNALEACARDGQDANKVLYVISEPGAGGTTLARRLAFEAALAGYPTIIAKPHVYEPDSTEVVSFLNRVRAIIAAKEAVSGTDMPDSDMKDTPWLLVFDRDQWDGQEQQIGNFLSEVSRSGRSVLVLKVLGQFVPEGIPPGHEIASLTHELDRDQVIRLGTHLNKYLKPFGRGKKESEWERFWEQHKPDIDTSIAAFWVTLDFWLRGLIDLGESVQGWLLNQFKQGPFGNDVRTILLEIAALTIERRSVPEHLLRLPESTLQPLSVVLENIRMEFPALALIRQMTSDGRFWAIAHDVLGRYLINACYHDRPLMKSLGLQNIQSPTELRLHLIGCLTRRTEIGESRFHLYAVQFAVKTLKLDEEGNAEFFQFWREVLDILEAFPQSVRDTSRAFNHHVAISRRRVAKSELFDCSVNEKRSQIQKAINQIEFALRLDEVYGGESNLNLYNSLALAYQDMAALELTEGGNPESVAALRAKANEATLNALRESPMNSYVLETAAKNLIQQARLDNSVKISSAAESLGYVFQAAKLESSSSRQFQLGRLANEALVLLRGADAGPEIEKMRAAGNAMGFLAAAWLELTRGQTHIGTASEDEFSEADAKRALDVLAVAPRHWLVVRLQYDIVCFLAPGAFEDQLQLLDELISMAAYRLPMQLRLNRAILLHIVGRHSDANLTFRELRGDIKAGNEMVTVPENLRWLVGKDGISRRVCLARVVDNIGYRPTAQVTELKNAQVPFIPQDFGGKRMPPGMSFKCHITFGAMGPFIKPPVQPH